MKSCLGLLAFFFSFKTFGAQLSLDFSNRQDFESGSLIFNQSLGVLHPSLQVMNFKAGFTPKAVEVGDGRHGAFNLSTYQNFSTNGDVSGNRIRLDISEFPILQVTNFELQQGWVLEVIGDGPLIIYSLKDVAIAGAIWCHGADGADAVGASPGVGGQGRCGGGIGGSGGLPSNDGVNGASVDVSVTGGQAGNFTGGAAVAGGGGGSWNTTSASGTGANVNGGGGQAGSMQSDPEFLIVEGGAGGGGGSGTAVAAGAGGGGGGGVVIIHTVRDFILGQAPTSNFGQIFASGGNGGDSNVQGGAGGGGGGGSVQVFAGRGMEIFNTNGAGASRANAGIGGQNSLVANGGNGGIGRHWYSNEVGKYNLSGTGYYTPAEQAPVSPGNVEFSANTQTMETPSYDLKNTSPSFSSVSPTPGSADFLVELKGSDDDFTNDDTGWTTNFNLINNKRYIKIRASITATNVNSPDMMDALEVNYAPGNKNEFDFTAASCGVVSTPPTPKVGFLFLLPLFCIFFFRASSIAKNSSLK